MNNMQQPFYQRPADQGVKIASIILFVAGFFLHIIGVLTIFLFFIGIPILIIAFICDVIAFVCLCFI